MQLMVRCPYRLRGCQDLTRLSDTENHAMQCKFRDKGDDRSRRAARLLSGGCGSVQTCESCGEEVEEAEAAGDGGGVRNGSGSSKRGVAMAAAAGKKRLVCPNILVACPFTSAGCEDRVPRRELSKHIQTQTHKHMKLLNERLLKMQQIQGASQPPDPLELEELDDGAAAVDSGPDSVPEGDSNIGLLHREHHARLSGSNIGATQKLLKDLFRAVMQLEQKNRLLEIRNEELSARMRDLSVAPPSQEALGRFCNGSFVWRVDDFSSAHDRMRRSRSALLWSPPFYTSAFGYRVCLRCNVSIAGGEEHLGVFMHLVAGDNDDVVPWPFRGHVVITVVKRERGRLDDSDFVQTMEADKRSNGGLNNALERPPAGGRNQFGVGFHEVIRMNGLYSGGFVTPGENRLVIKASVQPIMGFVQEEPYQNGHEVIDYHND